MDVQSKELEMMRGEIESEIRAIFKANMKIFDWDIPENDDRKSAKLIINVMQEAIDKLKQKIESGEFDNY
jgi:ribosomal protein S2